MERDDALVLALAAVVLLGFVAAELRVAGEIGLPLDDGWIHLRFADNLAAGRGFAINPGSPVAGSTAPAWTIALAFVVALGVPGLLAAKLLGAVAFGATGLLTRRLARAVHLSEPLALAAGLATVAWGRLAWGALSGMEVPLATALVAGGALLAARGRDLGAAATFGVAMLARPEAGLLVGLHALGAARLRAAAARVALAGVVLAPALLFNWATVGRPLPATAIAKVEGGLVGRLVGVTEPWAAAGARLAAWVVEWGGLLAADHAALPALGLLGLVALRRSRLRWLPWVLLLHPVAMAVAAPYRGPAFQTGRYSSHLVPLLVVVGVAGLGALLAALPSGRGLVRATAVGLAALALAWPLASAADAYAWGVQNINAMQVRLGRWVARATPPDALIAVNDVGALAYFGQRRIIDLMGLVTPDIVPVRRQGEPALLAYLERRCPDYVIVFPAWFPQLTARTDLLRPVARVRLARNVVAGADEMVAYETAWSRRSRPPGPCPGGRS